MKTPHLFTNYVFANQSKVCNYQNSYLYKIRLISFLLLFLIGSLLMILSMELSYFTPATHQDNVELLSPPSTAHSRASSYLVIITYVKFILWHNGGLIHNRNYIKILCRSTLNTYPIWNGPRDFSCRMYSPLR